MSQPKGLNMRDCRMGCHGLTHAGAPWGYFGSSIARQFPVTPFRGGTRCRQGRRDNLGMPQKWRLRWWFSTERACQHFPQPSLFRSALILPERFGCGAVGHNRDCLSVQQQIETGSSPASGRAFPLDEALDA